MRTSFDWGCGCSEVAAKRFGWRCQVRDKVIRTEINYEKDLFDEDTHVDVYSTTLGNRLLDLAFSLGRSEPFALRLLTATLEVAREN